MVHMQSVLAQQHNLTPSKWTIFVLRGVSLHLPLMSTMQGREGFGYQKKDQKKVFDHQKTKPTFIPRLLYLGKMTQQLGR